MGCCPGELLFADNNCQMSHGARPSLQNFNEPGIAQQNFGFDDQSLILEKLIFQSGLFDLISLLNAFIFTAI
jgi:hypothetical protein